MDKQKLLSLIIAFAIMLLGAGVAQAQDPAVDWWVIAGGGAPSSGTGVTLNDTLGQPVIGQATGSGDLRAQRRLLGELRGRGGRDAGRDRDPQTARTSC